MHKEKIIIAGGTGFLGQALINYFRQKGFDVKVLTRFPKSNSDILWDAKSLDIWKIELENTYALINLTGRSVDCRYTKKNREIILSSRINSTRVLGEAIKQCTNPPKYWLNSSTSTIYQNTEGDIPANSEDKGIIGSDFSMEIAKSWEKEFFNHSTPNTIKTALRTAIVMGKNGGAFPVMAKLAKLGLCSPQGTGEQWISWVHILDYTRAIDFILENNMDGIVNICSPNVIKNKDFNGLLKKFTKPLFCLPQPVWLLKFGAFFIRTQTELILKSRKVSPERLMTNKFEFKFLNIEDVFDDLLANN